MATTPSSNESTFGFDELFFSRTDSHGIIEFGNDVFVRVSRYPAEKMFGKPHNIVRHPDMPKSVFKLLWDTLKSDRMLCAYVKNMAADGSFYWVFAVAFPLKEGYLSIRLRPSSALFSAAKEIYAAMLEAEKSGGMEAGQALLMEKLREAGFPDYETFMTTALLAELKARDQERGAECLVPEDAEKKKGNSRNVARVVDEIESSSSQGTSCYRHLFSRIDDFSRLNQIFRDRTHSLLESFHDFQLISMNMAVASARFGETGRTLGVIATDFQRLAAEIERNLRDFSGAVGAVGKDMDACSRNVAAIKLQMDMVDFFVRESLKNLSEGKVSITDAFLPLEKNRDGFAFMTSRCISALRKDLRSLNERIGAFSVAATEIQKFVNGLEVAKQMGAVESGRLSSDQHDFENYINDMKKSQCDAAFFQCGHPKSDA